MALARKYRLAKKDSGYVFRKGETVKSSFFFIKFSENRIGHCRLAILVPAKVLKGSAVRNRLRRTIAEIFKAAGLEGRSLDMIFVATLSIVEKQSKEIKRELEQTLKNLFV